MTQFKLTILGCNSAVPAKNRYPTSQLLEWEGNACLIDCGEGTQMRFIDLNIKRGKISHIFISHMHGDHIFGLPGLVNSYILMGRTKPLKIYGPVGLRKYLDISVDFDRIPADFDVEVIELEDDSIKDLVEFGGVKVSTVKLNHKIPTTGFIFRHFSQDKKLNKQKIVEIGFSVDEIKLLLRGEDVERTDGSIFRNEDFTFPDEVPASYGYCSDTKYTPELAESYSEVSCLYHEATFLNDMMEQAEKRFHSTAEQAGDIAKLSNVKSLILGHFSNRYGNMNDFKKEAGINFSPVFIAQTGRKFTISNEGVEEVENLQDLK